MVRFVVVAVLLLAACGGAKSTQPSENRRQATGDRQEETGDRVPDGGAVAQVVVDAGAPMSYSDAGLVELGSSQCEMVIARVIACPNFDASIKKELEKKRVELRQLAVNAKNREMLAGACRQLVEEMEDMLNRLSC